ncbi:MAG: substrate-binding domain-containing protein [Planctomycetia bacterium]|nr:substrate-binding domain-containing protein [Planctomycetia bacterium]
MKNFKAYVITTVMDEYWRGILRGIAHYANLHGNWEIILSPYDFMPTAKQLQEWGSVGIITHPELFPDTAWSSQIHAPIIFLDNYPLNRELRRNPNIAGKIATNEQAITTTAFRYLQNQGVNHFAYVSFSGRPWSIKRKKYFAQVVSEAEKNLSLYLCKQEKISRRRYEQFKHWLIDLPKPAGILAGNDKSGRIILATCYNSHIKVPEEVSVIGVDNDALVCQMSIPPLTSIILDTEQAGYDAMQYLEQVLREDDIHRMSASEQTLPPVPRTRKIIPVVPVRIITRESTRKQTWNDEFVNRVYTYIQNNAHDPIRVDDVVQSVPLSKRLLQKRFREVTGTSLSEFIQASRLNNIKIYLQETDFSVKQIAQKMQFSSPSHLIHFFRQRTGLTPQQYRDRKGP